METEMSATDELRRLLDERGVEWWEDAFSSEHRTVFDGKDGVRYCVYQFGSLLFISSILPVTPEQAIAATLGRTCEVVSTIRYDYQGGYAGTEYVTELSCGHTYTDANGDGPDYCPWCGARVLEPHSNLLGQEER